MGEIKRRGYSIGIDIGGTFTDIVVLDHENGTIARVLKEKTTPKNPAKGAIRAINRLERNILRRTELIFHATTIATNLLLGQLGLDIPKCALITTKGFRDIIEIGRQRRPELYNLFFEKPKPLIPRRFRYEVDERVDPSGRVLRRPSNEEIRRIAEDIRRNNIVSVAISFINSYANPENEKAVEKILRKLIPGIMLSISSEVDNQYREYERTGTTVVNAVLMPVVSEYLRKLDQELSTLCPRGRLLIMKSDGGTSGIEFVSRRPVSIIESGPASGVIASRFIGGLLEERNIISFDMGGTTAKSGAIVDGRPIITTEYEVAGKIHAGRIIKGSGYPVRYPFIDLAEISSGGGSIIWIDKAGGLRVGPISAGADPGPACYGKGGRDPTITDANLVLGRIGETTLLGGEMRIYRDLSLRAFKEKICSISSYDPIEAAAGAIKIANVLMGKILRIVTIERGLDPRDFALVAFGGAGPMHACALAEGLEIRKIIVPKFPGVFSAVGLVVADVKHVYLCPIMRTADQIEIDELCEKFCLLRDNAVKDLSRLGFSSDRITICCYLDMRYRGQGYELLVEIPDIEAMGSIGAIVERFHSKHERVYGYRIEDEDVELVNMRVEAIGLVGGVEFMRIKTRGRENPEEAVKEYRECYFETLDEFIRVPVYDKNKLYAGDTISGPAIVEQYDATTIVYPGWNARVDQYGNIIMRYEKHG